jgi:hypothetical protein
MTAVQIEPVTGRRELDTFIKLPWRLYRNEPTWVTPLIMDLRKRLDQRRNPFFKHAEAARSSAATASTSACCKAAIDFG